MSPMSARRAALAAARVERCGLRLISKWSDTNTCPSRNKKLLGARALGQEPTPSGSQAALHRTTSRTGMRDVAFDTRRTYNFLSLPAFQGRSRFAFDLSRERVARRYEARDRYDSTQPGSFAVTKFPRPVGLRHPEAARCYELHRQS